MKASPVEEVQRDVSGDTDRLKRTHARTRQFLMSMFTQSYGHRGGDGLAWVAMPNSRQFSTCLDEDQTRRTVTGLLFRLI